MIDRACSKYSASGPPATLSARRQVGLWDLKEKSWTQVARGSEITWAPDSAAVLWVNPSGKELSEILRAQLEEGSVFVGIEGLTPAFHDALVAPATFVPAGARWLVIDPDAGRRAIQDAWIDAETRYAERRAAQGTKDRALAYPPAAHYLTADEALTGERRVLLPTLELVDEEGTRLRAELDDLRVLKQELDHARTFGDTEHVTPLLAAMKQWNQLGLRVAIACDSQSRTDRLQGVLAARGVVVRAATAGERPTREVGITLVPGAPTRSFASPKKVRA